MRTAVVRRFATTLGLALASGCERDPGLYDCLAEWSMGCGDERVACP